MTITWLGHSCFAVESGGYTLVLDPYFVPSYPALHTEANAILCSHDHRDHAFTEAVTLREGGESPFTVARVATFHDEVQGAKRGENTVHILSAEGLKLVHLGDLGHALSSEQLAAMRGCDLLLLPVGGFYTIDAATAKRVAEAIAPRAIVPMHYRHGSYGYDVIATVDDFLALYPESSVHRLSGNSFSLTEATPRGVVVPKFMG